MQLFLKLTEPSVPQPVLVLKEGACLELMCLIGPGGVDKVEYSRYCRTQCKENLHCSGIPENLCHLTTWGSRRWKLEPKNSHCMRAGRDQWVLEMLLCVRKSRSTLNQTGSSNIVSRHHCNEDPINPHYIERYVRFYALQLFSIKYAC